jgi:hypothetical protein
MAEQGRDGSPPGQETTCSQDKILGRRIILAKTYLQEPGTEVWLGKKQPAHHWGNTPLELLLGRPPKPIHDLGLQWSW